MAGIVPRCHSLPNQHLPWVSFARPVRRFSPAPRPGRSAAQSLRSSLGLGVWSDLSSDGLVTVQAVGPLVTEPADAWAFGNGGFAKLYGDRLAQSSLLDRDVATRWAFVFILSQADSEGRYRCASAVGLARAAALTLEQAEKAVAELEAPDPDSTTKDHEGRRLLRIPGGWQVLNYLKYREFRSARQVAEAEKKRRQRAAARGDMSRDVPGTSAPDIRRQTSDERHQTPPHPPKGGARGVLVEFVNAFNAIYDRRVRVPAINRSQEQQLRRLAASYGTRGICCLPLLAWCFDKSRDRATKDRAVSHLLRDGERGTFVWATLLETAPAVARCGGVVTTERRLWRVADQLGLGEALEGFGCERPLDAAPGPPVPASLEQAKAEGRRLFAERSLAKLEPGA